MRLYLAGTALTGAAHTVTFTLLARYLDAIGLTKAQVGSVLAADAWGKVLVALPAAWILARRPARGVFVTAAVVGGGAYIVLPWVGDVRLLILVNGVAGFAMTLHYVAIAPFLFRHAAAHERARTFGTAEAVRTLASVVGAFAAGAFVAAWQEPLGGEAPATARAIAAAGVVAMAAGLVYARIEDAPPALGRGTRWLPVLREHRGVLARFAAPQFLIACGAGFCIPFLPLYFKDRFDLSPGTWGNLFASGQVMMSAGFLLTPLVLARLGFVRSIVAIELSSIPFFLLMAFTGRVEVAMLAFLLRGSLMNSTHPLHKNLMMKATPPGVREAQTGINAALWGVGWVVGPLAAGHVLQSTGDDYMVLMVSTAGLYVLAATLTWVLLRPVEEGTRSRPEGAGAAGALASREP